LADVVCRNIFTACSGRGDLDREQACEEMKECVARAETHAFSGSNESDCSRTA
jgi:hypothetical protein